MSTVDAAVARPLPNTYWVQPGLLLAGEYPGAGREADAEVRLRRLLEAGVRCFVDLTEPRELPAYDPLLARLDAAVRHHRFPIRDHGLPESPLVVVAALDCIDAALRQRLPVYVHCRAGLGRTGTVLGCHFVRQGLAADLALSRLAALWRQSERARVLPFIPETDEQTAYVRAWSEPDAASMRPDAGRVAGALRGMALAEAAALGRPGQWGAHTAMTLLVAESMARRRASDPDDQLQRYFDWQQHSRLPGGTFPLVPPEEVRRAVAVWRWSRKTFAGSHDPAKSDAHALPRTAAVALYLQAQPGLAIDAAVEATRTTSQSPTVLDCARCFAALIVDALAGLGKAPLLALSGAAGAALSDRAVKPEVRALLDSAWKSARPPAAAGATGALSVALWAFATTADFATGLARVLAAAREPVDAAALYGALAGAHYSRAGLPVDADRQLADAALLEAAIRGLPATDTESR